ncbi:MAG: c-type cytochrome biogenesis protein CcsB [Tissierellia bacterium]|nr:c-type cytochrome biogenesis protein CcsB [Tissierellia bacterium]
MLDNFGKLEDILFTVAVLSYLISMVLYFAVLISHKEKIGKYASIILKIAFGIHTLAIIARGIGAGRFPLANQYEFATSFAWGIALFLIIFETKYKYSSIGAFVVPILFLIIGYAAMQNKEVRPLMPALQSGWLAIHVSMAIIGYGSFAVACGVAAMYLVKQKHPDSVKVKLPEAQNLDNISYRAIMLGYFFLTLTIITGALWAQKAWGRYWAWDPKETWSLITWIIYTAYLHMRKVKGMKGEKAAWFAVIGFICVVFTYIGVNTLIPSIHSYK